VTSADDLTKEGLPGLVGGAVTTYGAREDEEKWRLMDKVGKKSERSRDLRLGRLGVAVERVGQ
jgi:hypothetical protein